MRNRFQDIATKVSLWTGSAVAFALALLLVIVWLLAGPSAHFSNTWLLAITVISDVIIFLMVFLMQNSQNRDSKAIQLKLNELISVNQKARDTFIGLENLTDTELTELDEEFKRLLSTLEVAPSMHKLHKHIAHEKERRFNLPRQAEHLVDALLGPFNGVGTHPKEK